LICDLRLELTCSAQVVRDGRDSRRVRARPVSRIVSHGTQSYRIIRGRNLQHDPIHMPRGEGFAGERENLFPGGVEVYRGSAGSAQGSRRTRVIGIQVSSHQIRRRCSGYAIHLNGLEQPIGRRREHPPGNVQRGCQRRNRSCRCPVPGSKRIRCIAVLRGDRSARARYRGRFQVDTHVGVLRQVRPILPVNRRQRPRRMPGAGQLMNRIVRVEQVHDIGALSPLQPRDVLRGIRCRHFIWDAAGYDLPTVHIEPDVVPSELQHIGLCVGKHERDEPGCDCSEFGRCSVFESGATFRWPLRKANEILHLPARISVLVVIDLPVHPRRPLTGIERRLHGMCRGHMLPPRLDPGTDGRIVRFVPAGFDGIHDPRNRSRHAVEIIHSLHHRGFFENRIGQITSKSNR